MAFCSFSEPRAEGILMTHTLSAYEEYKGDLHDGDNGGEHSSPRSKEAKDDDRPDGQPIETLRTDSKVEQALFELFFKGTLICPIVDTISAVCVVQGKQKEAGTLIVSMALK